jgi:hypothetical protein
MTGIAQNCVDAMTERMIGIASRDVIASTKASERVLPGANPLKRTVPRANRNHSASHRVMQAKVLKNGACSGTSKRSFDSVSYGIRNSTRPTLRITRSTGMQSLDDIASSNPKHGAPHKMLRAKALKSAASIRTSMRTSALIDNVGNSARPTSRITRGTGMPSRNDIASSKASKRTVPRTNRNHTASQKILRGRVLKNAASRGEECVTRETRMTRNKTAVSVKGSGLLDTVSMTARGLIENSFGDLVPRYQGRVPSRDGNDQSDDDKSDGGSSDDSDGYTGFALKDIEHASTNPDLKRQLVKFLELTPRETFSRFRKLLDLEALAQDYTTLKLMNAPNYITFMLDNFFDIAMVEACEKNLAGVRFAILLQPLLRALIIAPQGLVEKIYSDGQIPNQILEAMKREGIAQVTKVNLFVYF